MNRLEQSKLNVGGGWTGLDGSLNGLTIRAPNGANKGNLGNQGNVGNLGNAGNAGLALHVM